MVCKPSVCDAQVKSYSWAKPGFGESTGHFSCAFVTTPSSLVAMCHLTWTCQIHYLYLPNTQKLPTCTPLLASLYAAADCSATRPHDLAATWRHQRFSASADGQARFHVRVPAHVHRGVVYMCRRCASHGPRAHIYIWQTTHTTHVSVLHGTS